MRSLLPSIIVLARTSCTPAFGASALPLHPLAALGTAPSLMNSIPGVTTGGFQQSHIFDTFFLILLVITAFVLLGLKTIKLPNSAADEMRKCDACGKVYDGQDKCEECELAQALHDYWKDRPLPSDEGLFAAPQPAEECQICLLPLDPTSGLARSHEEEEEMAEQRIKKHDDANTIFYLACCLDLGAFGSHKDSKKATKLYFQAFLKGRGWGAAEELGFAYACGRGVERDNEVAKKWLTLAAIEGSVLARGELSKMEMDAGNTCRAMKHLLIAAGAGDDESLKEVTQGYKDGHVKKDDLDKALRAHERARRDMKSDLRDAVDKMLEKRALA
ncbi:hypothetical protein ACHAWF_006316 [Thalassiosira exigua]